MGKRKISPGKLKPLKFDWNEHNKFKNWEKHQVDYRECEQVFFNKPLKVFLDFNHSGEEKRFVAYGRTNSERKISIIFTLREGKVRVISARNQSRKERKSYEQK